MHTGDGGFLALFSFSSEQDKYMLEGLLTHLRLHASDSSKLSPERSRNAALCNDMLNNYRTTKPTPVSPNDKAEHHWPRISDGDIKLDILWIVSIWKLRSKKNNCGKLFPSLVNIHLFE